MTPEAAEPRFEFGRNWRSFVEGAVDEPRIEAAVSGLRRLLCVERLDGRSFLDVGCGSGLSSLAALLIGAERVVAFDYDLHSLEASRVLRERAGAAAKKWEILHGSILDDGFLASLAPSDVVYSWGVLHHTGAMWRAIDNAAGLVVPGGLLAISIYNRVDRRFGGSAMWWHVKRRYNLSPAIVRRLMEVGFVAGLCLRQIAGLRNPIRYVRGYGLGRDRGMDFWHDVRDWLGGFPYEYATAGEVFHHVHRNLGFTLEYLNTTNARGCNELTFRRPG